MTETERAIRRAALEEAAQIAERHYRAEGRRDGKIVQVLMETFVHEDCPMAAAIRALADQPAAPLDEREDAAVAPSDAEIGRVTRALCCNEECGPVCEVFEAAVKRAITALRAMDRERGLVTAPLHTVRKIVSTSKILHALVNGECPSLLEDDHHDDLAREGVRLGRAMIEAHEREAGQ